MLTSNHRFLVNNRNILRDAVLSALSVEPAQNSVLLDDTIRRNGTAQLIVDGPYTGPEEATYEVEIVDSTVGENLVSAPLFSGAGTGTISEISASGTPQTYVVELFDPGVIEAKSAVDFEGVQLVSRTIPGTGIAIEVDQSSLVFEDTIYSLLTDLSAGAGSPITGIEGQGMDWDTKVMGSDNIIPDDAHRIVFGDDKTVVYLAYKRYVASGAKWLYHFVPELKRNVPAGTPIKFVSGGRTVRVLVDDTIADEFDDIVTVYDFLHAVKTESTVIDVDGVVAVDRSPAGQSSREFLLRTDAHAEPASGSGKYANANALMDISVAENAATELVTLTCHAVTEKDAATAHLGAELWTVEGSLSGNVGEMRTGVPFVHPDGRWGFTVKQQFPATYGNPRGKFSANPPQYVGTRENPPPICVRNMALGPNAVDGTITLKWTKRPSGDCSCKDMPVEPIDAACLGIYVNGEREFGMYSDENRERLEDLYLWQGNTVRQRSHYLPNGNPEQAPFVSQPSGGSIVTQTNTDGSTVSSPIVATFFTRTLFDLVAEWEKTLKLLNDLPTGSPDGVLRAQAELVWDTRIEEFKSDVTGGTSRYGDFVVFEDLTKGDAVAIFADNDGVEKVRKAIEGAIRYGFVTEDYAAGSPLARVYYFGNNEIAGSSFTVGGFYAPSKTVPGGWTSDVADQIAAQQNAQPLRGVASNATMIAVSNPLLNNYNNVYYALLADRYRARMQEVLITGGISPLGKSDADIIESGDGCWRDWNDAYYFTVTGPDRSYAPAFANHVYISSRLSTDEKRYYSTKEFAFQVNVKCPEQLQEGDQIELNIGDAGWPPTYNVNDQIVLPIVARQPFRLTGGRVGSPVTHWSVHGSVDGPLPTFAYDPGDSSNVYDEGGFHFKMQEGGLLFEKGDKFTVDIEGGSWRWRKIVDGVPGGWSSEAAIRDDSELLDDGLSIRFVTGTVPSFVAADRFMFRALQPRAVSNVRKPTGRKWKWVDPDTPLYVDALSTVTVSDFAIALHTLPQGSTITVAFSNDGMSYGDEEIINVYPGAVVAEFAEAHEARYLRVTFSAVGSVGWIWAGVPVTSKMTPDIVLRRQYKMDRNDGGLFGGGVFAGAAVGGTVVWTEGSLAAPEATDLTDAYHWSKTRHDEPFIFVPNITEPREVLLARFVDDELPIEDEYFYGLTKSREAAVGGRRFAATFSLNGVWQK